jgi:hypothetical protein
MHHDTQHNDIQHNGTQQNDIQHNNNYGSVAMLSVAAGIIAVVFKFLKILWYIYSLFGSGNLHVFYAIYSKHFVWGGGGGGGGEYCVCCKIIYHISQTW